MRPLLEYADLHIKYLKSAPNQDNLNRLLQALVSRVNTDAMVYTMGNGGSLATAEHFAADLNLTLKRADKRIRALCIGMQVASMTALSNDYSYEAASEYLLENYLRPGDLLVGFSVSGNSLNLVNAIERATKSEIEVFTFSGSDGGVLKDIFNNQSIHVPSPKGEYGIVENIHLMMCHYLIDSLMEQLVL